MVILKQQLPDIHFQVGIQRGQRLCSVEVDFGSWKKAQCRCRSVVCAGIPDYVFTKLSGSTYSAGCSGGIYINSSYDVSDRVVGIVE